MAETEDVPYTTTQDFATPEKDNQQDPDQPNKSVLKKVVKYLDKQIETHNSLDLVEPNAEKSVMSTQQQVAVQKQVVSHLRNIRTEILNKIEELK